MTSTGYIIDQVHRKWVEAYKNSVPFQPDSWRGEDYNYSYMDVEAPLEVEQEYHRAVKKALKAGTADVVEFGSSKHPRRMKGDADEAE